MTSENPLGQATSYADTYSPDLLHAIVRSDSRGAIGLRTALPFHGTDFWNAWELSWLSSGGVPQVATAEIVVPADSANIVESKSLKLYLGSFAMTRHESDADIAAIISKDLSGCVGSDVYVAIRRPSSADVALLGRLPGECIDDLPIRCDRYDVAPELLSSVESELVTENLHSHLLRSLCPVTGQPDIGSVLFSYRGPRIDRESLLGYVVSYRQHQDFHEACVERMFVDVQNRCGTEQLTVYARYQRRGGIDINPFRSNFETALPNQRLWRQ